MLENSVPPVMRATGSEKLSWLDEHQTMVQAMEDMAIPKSAGLTVFKVCHDEQSDNTKRCLLNLVCSSKGRCMICKSTLYTVSCALCHNGICVSCLD